MGPAPRSFALLPIVLGLAAIIWSRLWSRNAVKTAQRSGILRVAPGSEKFEEQYVRLTYVLFGAFLVALGVWLLLRP